MKERQGAGENYWLAFSRLLTQGSSERTTFNERPDVADHWETVRAFDDVEIYQSKESLIAWSKTRCLRWIRRAAGTQGEETGRGVLASGADVRGPRDVQDVAREELVHHGAVEALRLQLEAVPHC
jgi:hypothetical protein